MRGLSLAMVLLIGPATAFAADSESDVAARHADKAPMLFSNEYRVSDLPFCDATGKFSSDALFSFLDAVIPKGLRIAGTDQRFGHESDDHGKTLTVVATKDTHKGIQKALNKLRADIAPDRVFTATYRVSDLPVYGPDGHLDFALLIAHIQAKVDPPTWERNGGNSSMQPYPQNVSLTVSTSRANHRAVGELLDGFRKRAAAD